MPIETLEIPTADGQADAFAAFPDHGERHPGVPMYADGFGIRPVLRELAHELAGHGYYVLVPNLWTALWPMAEAPDTDLKYRARELQGALASTLCNS